MDEFNYGINADQVFFDGQDILSVIEPMNDCQVSSDFLNPINDILNDINDFDKKFTYDQVDGSFQLPGSSDTTAASTAYINLADDSKLSDQTNCVEDIASGFYSTNFNSTSLQCEDLLPVQDASATVEEFVEAMSVNNWVQSVADATVETKPQKFTDDFLNTISSLPSTTTITPIPLYTEEKAAYCSQIFPLQQEGVVEINLLPQSNTEAIPNQLLLAVQNENLNKHQDEFEAESSSLSAGPSTQNTFYALSTNCSTQQNSLQTKRFANKNRSFANNNVSRLTSSPSHFQNSSINFDNTYINLTAIIPRNHFTQPPEIIVMRPLRTRKPIVPHRTDDSIAIEKSYNSNVNLSEYFDTSSIEIPLIPERERDENKVENRRKQKLSIIPGSDNLIFEVQKCEKDVNFQKASVSIDEQEISSKIDPYPEGELPEVDEIFRRKKKSHAMPATFSKKCSSIAESIVGTRQPPQKKQYRENYAQQQQSIQESSTSFEEKVSLSKTVRRSRMKTLLKQNRCIFTSESDSVESDFELKFSDSANKSFKCQKCRKLFKTSRSLEIHSKRCITVRDQRDLSSDDLSDKEEVNKITRKRKLNILESNKEQKKNISSDEINDNKDIVQATKEPIKAKIPNICNDKNKPRQPITRSQTRRSTGRSITLLNRTNH